MLGSIDANRGDAQNGWDTDQFPIDLNELVESMNALNQSEFLYTIFTSSSGNPRLNLMPGTVDSFLMKPFSARHLHDSIANSLKTVRYW